MKFMVEGVDPTQPELIEFRVAWLAAVAEENELLTGQKAEASEAQTFVVDLFCKWEDGHEGHTTICGDLPSQVEFEALIRARNRALAEAFHRGDA